MIIDAEQRVVDFLAGESHTVPSVNDANKFLRRQIFGEGISHSQENCPWLIISTYPDYTSQWSQVGETGKQLVENMKEPPLVEPSQIVALVEIGLNMQILADKALGEGGDSPFVVNQ